MGPWLIGVLCAPPAMQAPPAAGDAAVLGQPSHEWSGNSDSGTGAAKGSGFELSCQEMRPWYHLVPCYGTRWTRVPTTFKAFAIFLELSRDCAPWRLLNSTVMLLPGTGVERKESSYPHFTKEEAGAQSGEGTEYHSMPFGDRAQKPSPRVPRGLLSWGMLI